MADNLIVLPIRSKKAVTFDAPSRKKGKKITIYHA